MSKSLERDTALAIADTLARITEEHGVFVLTGSYSIDALTGGDVAHNDIDANLFVEGAVSDKVAIVNQDIVRNVAVNEKILERADRLEYVIQSGEQFETAELQFFGYEGYEKESADGLLVLPGKNGAGNTIQVPLTEVTLVDSRGSSYEFRVKSLEYAIATWAIRISGIINYQKRPVRKTDIDHFSLLLNQSYETDSVYNTLSHHPQMVSVAPEVVLGKAKEIIGYR